MKKIAYIAAAILGSLIAFIAAGPWFGLAVVLCFIFVPRLL